MNYPTIHLTLLFLSFFHVPYLSYAETVPGGVKIVRIDDDAESKCINIRTDSISLHLRRILISKDIGWFTQDKEVGLVLNTEIQGQSLNGRDGVSFPQLHIATVESYAKGVVSVPLEIRLFHRFSLSTDNKSTYDGIKIDFVVLKKVEKTAFGAGLTALADATKSFPMPNDPFSQSFKFAASFSTNVLEKSIKEKNSIADSVKEGTISLAFSDGICRGDLEKTGTIAVIKGFDGKESDGSVAIEKDYCWRSLNRPSFELKFADIPKSGFCKDVKEGEFRVIKNPYFLLVLIAHPNNSTTSDLRVVRIDSFSKQIKDPVVNVSMDSVKDILESSITGFLGFPAGNLDNAVLLKIDEKLKKPEIPSPQKNILSEDEYGQTIQWETTRADSYAYEVAQSIRRCKFHDIPLEQCF